MERHHLERCKLSGTAQKIVQHAFKSFVVSCAGSEEDSAAFSKDTELETRVLWRTHVSFQKSLRGYSFFPPFILCKLLCFVVMFCSRAGLAEALGQGNFFKVLELSLFISRTRSS